METKPKCRARGMSKELVMKTKIKRIALIPFVGALVTVSIVGGLIIATLAFITDELDNLTTRDNP